MNNAEVNNAYFAWLYDAVARDRYSDNISYRKLLMELHSIEFLYFVSRDQNRAIDGAGLRYRFAKTLDCNEPLTYILNCLQGPCSVLEMMVALAIRCEQTIMDDPQIGDRTGEWFWGMIVNLGLGSMTDDNYDKNHVRESVDRFLYREYEPDGRGGLFTVRNCPVDLRNVEIFYQLCYFLDTIV